MECPNYNILASVALPQKVCIIFSKAKDLEDTIEKIDAEYKACIVELDAKLPGMPRTKKEARAQAIKGHAGTVEAHIEEDQKLLNDAVEAWTNMEDIDDLVKIRNQL